ncbi:MAG: hypothetical protein QUU85_03695 [Candidatus Eisenbacteria bacterium]|nr:hypothetical protein [Candidatus Eisenbacteria bacterium]
MSSILDGLDPQRRHDLKGAVRVLRFAVEALQAGERFEGEEGREQIESLAKAVATVEEVLGLRAGG